MATGELKSQPSSIAGSAAHSSPSASIQSQSPASKSKSFFSLQRITTRFYSTVVRSQLVCPKDWRIFAIVCFWIHFFQFSSIITSFRTSSSTENVLSNNNNETNTSGSQISWNEGWKVLAYFVRPTQYVFVEYNEQYQRINLAAILALFACLAFLIFSFIVGSLLIDDKSKRAQGFLLLSIFVNFSSCFNFIFSIPIHETLLLLLANGSITSDSQSSTTTTTTTTATADTNSGLSSSQELINKACAVVLLIMFQLYSYMCSKFFEVSFSLNERGLQRYSQDNLAIFLNHFRILSLVAYAFDRDDSSNGITYVSVVSCVYFLASFYDLFVKKPISCMVKQQSYLLSLSLNTLFMFCMIFDKLATLTNSSRTITFLIVLSPLFLKFALDITRNLNTTQLYSNLIDESEITSDSDDHLSRKIAMLVNNTGAILSVDQLKFFGVYEAHKTACKRQTCFCKYSAARCNEGTKFLLSSDILKRYVRYLIRTELAVSNLNEKIHRMVFFIRYITCLSEQRKHSFAISKLIDFINESDRMRKVYDTQVRVSIDTMLNILKSIMFENIVQIITDDEVEQQLTDIDLYVRMDNEKSQLKDGIAKCIEKRIATFEKMRKNFEDYTELEALNAEYNACLDALESRFTLFYDRFPTKQNQSFYVFFQAEVKGNLKKALQITNTRKFISTAQAKKLFNVFEPNVLYLTATMGKIWGKIVNYSDKLPAALGYKKQEFNYVTHIKDIMPTSIATIHDEIIRCMMTQGNDTIINNQRQIFLKNKSNVLIRVNVFISMNLYYTHELPFGVFVTPIETRSGFLFVTSAGFVEGLDQGILNIVGHSTVQNLPPYFQFKVQMCLPEFENYAQYMETNNLSLFDKVDVPFNFFAKTHQQFEKLFNTKSYTNTVEEMKKAQKRLSQSQSSARIYTDQDSSFRQSIRKMGSTQGAQGQNILKFKADITIERHKIRMLEYVYVYYIVEVKCLVRVASNDEFFISHKSVTSQGGNNGIPNQPQVKSQFGSKRTLNYEESVSEKKTFRSNKSRSRRESNSKSPLPETDNRPILSERFSLKDQNLHLNSSRSAIQAATTDRQGKVIKLQQQYPPETNRSFIQDEYSLLSFHATERQPAAGSHLINDQTIQQYQIKEPLSLRNPNEGSSFQKAMLVGDSTGVDLSNQQSMDTTAIILPLEHKFTFTQANDENNSSYENPNPNQQNRRFRQEEGSQFTQQNSLDCGTPYSRMQQQQQQEQQILQMQQQQEEKSLQQNTSAKLKRKNKKGKNSFNEREEQDLKELLQKDKHKASVASSTDSLHRSLDKFSYYEEFISSTSHPLHLRTVRYTRVLEYAIILIATIASILTLYTSFDTLLQNIDTLTLHSNILHPYANTLALSNSHYLLYDKAASISTLNTMHSILTSRQTNQFDIYNSMIQQEVTNTYLTNYFTDEHVQIYEPIQLAGTEVMKQFENPERTFLSVNYSRFLEFFEDLVGRTLSNSIEYNASLLKNIIVQTVILNVITLIIFSVSAWNYYYFSKNLMSILKMCETATTISVESEMLRYQKLIDRIVDNENILYTYQFSIYQKEKELTSHHKDPNNTHTNINTHQMSSNTAITKGGGGSKLQSTSDSKNSNSNNNNQNNILKRKKLLVSVQHESIKYTKFALFIAFCYSLFILFTISTYILNTNFLNNFEPAIQYYKRVSDSNYQISSVIAIRALLNEYQWLSASATGKDTQEYKLMNTTGLKQFYTSQLDSLLEYNIDILNFNKLSFFSGTLKTELDSLVNGNVCSTADDGLDLSWSPSRCSSIQKGILTQGLKNSISKHHGVLSSYSQLGFAETISGEDLFWNALDETYISITLTNYTLSMRNKIKNSLSENTQSQKDLNLIISVAFISLASLIYLYEILVGLKEETNRFGMAKKIIFLVPLQTSMIEETFIKILKAQSSRLEIIK